MNGATRWCLYKTKRQDVCLPLLSVITFAFYTCSDTFDQTHLDLCQEIVVACPNHCGVRCPRKEVNLYKTHLHTYELEYIGSYIYLKFIDPPCHSIVCYMPYDLCMNLISFTICSMDMQYIFKISDPANLAFS